MNEQQALAKMKAPKDKRGPRGIFQIWITRACDKACFGCTQGSQLGGKPGFITLEQYETALKSMDGYFGVVAMFGGNPCLHPKFEELCILAKKYIPYSRRGIWTNNLVGKGAICRKTFNPAMSNFNVHLDQRAAEEFRRDWPETSNMLKGLDHDSSHSPPYVAMKDVLRKPCPTCNGENYLISPPREQQEKEAELGLRKILTKKPCPNCTKGEIYDKEKAWELISQCDINQKWSAMIGVFRGQLRAWFCEIAGAQSMLHQDDPDYPDTGLEVTPGWWKRPMEDYAGQVRKHCHECGIPLRGVGTLATNGDKEQVSLVHLNLFQKPKRKRKVEIVTKVEQLGRSVPHATDYLANYKYQPKEQ